MSKKLVVKLIATVMAMTIVLGSAISVFAETPLCEHQYNEECSGREIDGVWYHGPYCIKCGQLDGTRKEECTMLWASLNYEGQKVHVKSCTVCHITDMSTKEAHTLDSNGVCTVCLFDPNNIPSCGESSSSSSSTSSEPVKPTAEQMHEEFAKAVEAKEAAEEALPVSSFQAPAPAAVAESLPAGTYNLSNVTTTKGFVSAVGKIAKATPANNVTVYSTKPISFNSDSLAAVVNTGKAFTYVFNYNGHTYSVTIPAGANVNGLLGSGRFAGPLYLGAVFGTTQLVK